MRQVSIDEALKKGKVLLIWVPMIIMFCCFGLGILILILLNKIGYIIPLAASLFVSAFVIPWIWWSLQVVKWKIWAFTNVENIKGLEKRAIATQLIWPHGSWFEKTEIKSKEEKLILNEIYKKLETAIPTREKVFDNSLPNQFIIKYPIANVYFYVLMMAIGIYLVYEDRLVLGTAAIIGSGYLAFDLFKKISKKQFVMKLDQKGVTLNHTFLPWAVIEEYYVEKSGFGSSTSFSVIIKGQDVYESISISEANTNAFTIEKYMDIYRTRYALKNNIK